MSKPPTQRSKPSTMRNNNPVSLIVRQTLFRVFGSTLPKLMSWWAFRLWSQTHRFDPPARENRLQLRASECSLTVNDIKIKAWKWGSGPSVLLVHGWNGRGMQMGRLVDPLLSAGYQVITFDAPAHGQSDGTHTHLLQIRDVIIALSKLHGPLHAAIGHSFGVAALSAAITTGVSVRNLVAISSPGGLSKLIGRYCKAMRIPPATEQYLRRRLQARIGSRLWQQFEESYPLNAGVERSFIVHDKHDEWVDWQESEQLQQCWPNAELVLTESLGHGRILRDPTVIREIAAFVDSNVLGDPLTEDLTLN